MVTRQAAIVFSALGLLLVVAVGLLLADLPYSYRVCAGDIVSTDLCEPARLGRTIFGAVVVGSTVIAGAILGAAAMLGNRSSKEDLNPGGS